MKNTVTINQLKEMISESIKNALMEADRHRPGYYAEYAKKRKEQGKPVDRHKPGYYKKYNAAHPERLQRLAKLKYHRRDYNDVDPYYYELEDMAWENFNMHFKDLSKSLQRELEWELEVKMAEDNMDISDGYGDWYPGDN